MQDIKWNYKSLVVSLDFDIDIYHSVILKLTFDKQEMRCIDRQLPVLYFWVKLF